MMNVITSQVALQVQGLDCMEEVNHLLRREVGGKTWNHRSRSMQM